MATQKDHRIRLSPIKHQWSLQKFFSSRVWNKLPTQVSSASTPPVFRRNLEHHFLLDAYPGFTAPTIKIESTYYAVHLTLSSLAPTTSSLLHCCPGLILLHTDACANAALLYYLLICLPGLNYWMMLGVFIDKIYSFWRVNWTQFFLVYRFQQWSCIPSSHFALRIFLWRLTENQVTKNIPSSTVNITKMTAMNTTTIFNCCISLTAGSVQCKFKFKSVNIHNMFS